MLKMLRHHPLMEIMQMFLFIYILFCCICQQVADAVIGCEVANEANIADTQDYSEL